MGEVVPKIEWDEEAKIATVIGRFYLWQKQDEKGGLLELQADNAVIFSVGEQLAADRDRGGAGDILAKGAASAIYMSGDIVMTEGRRTIRADEMYYDFEGKKGIAINAVMRTFDVSEGIPIYVRAAKLKRLAENEFEADNPTLTTSEFYLPQLSLNASKIIITDTTTIDEREDRVSKSSYEALMHDVRLKVYDKTIFYLPVVRSNLERPDSPIKSAHAGHDSDWGVMLETRWYLARLLGLREPEGIDSTFALDYYSKRGVGVGVEIDYQRENYFGSLLGYGIHDRGEDNLGRAADRRDLKPPRELRGRFSWRHRHFLPYSWQLTTGIDYESDEHFVESYYRNEFMVGLERETYIHLKRIEDNWGLSFLGKMRINDFVDKLEELPTAELHWTGQSFLDDKLTFYSDNQVSRFRQRYASGGTPPGLEEFFTFMSTRNEVDMPMTIGKAKVVPFVAGTVAYEDGLGFYRELGGATAGGEENVWLGEAGVRASSQPYWKVFPDVKSRLWDLNQLRHIINPYVTVVGYTESDSVIEQRDSATVGISQRLQTKRGSGDKQRTVDWMRLDTDVTWVNDSADASDAGPGPDQFIWNKPFIPLLNRRSSDVFGPRRNYFGADYIWRLSDTSAVLSDMNFDMQSAVVQQFNIGFSGLRWPNLSYYIGSRYLRRLEILDPEGLSLQKGSNAFTFALTYVLDPRYTVVFSQQYDFDYGANVQREIALIRRYHRVYCGLTYSADDSMDRHSIVFSIWPQGIPELAIGQRRYMRLTR
ncbi:LPS-assembly protein LptD [subsurface metagenome]